MPSNTGDAIESAVRSFLTDTEGIELVFLFGSAALDRLTPESDIDIGVLFSAMPDAFKVNELRDSLGATLRRDVDLVVLNQASPILKMQVLRNGKLLYRRTSAVYERFFVAAVNEYDDLKRIRRPIEEAMLKGHPHA